MTLFKGFVSQHLTDQNTMTNTDSCSADTNRSSGSADGCGRHERCGHPRDIRRAPVRKSRGLD